MSKEIKATNISWSVAHVTQEQREERNAHKAAVVWFTGLSASGKSTIALAVEDALFKLGCHTYILDGDNIRHGLNKDLGFSPEDREENIRRIGEVAGLFAHAGAIALTAFISPYRRDRDEARKVVPEGSFIEVFVNCPLEVCEERDPKGLYKKARSGDIPEFTGISAPYEAPLEPEITVDTSENTVEECTQIVIDEFRKRGIISK